MVTSIDLARCKLVCLDDDSFAFPGARGVTDVNIQDNDLPWLPERLLWETPALLAFSAERSAKLTTIPERFFRNSSRLTTLKLTSSVNLGSVAGLPRGLFLGLGSLEVIDFSECGYRSLPSMDDLTALRSFHGEASTRVPPSRTAVWHAPRPLLRPGRVKPANQTPPAPQSLVAAFLGLLAVRASPRRTTTSRGARRSM